MNLLNLPAFGALCALIGPPGSGKSTFAARYPDSWRVCLDEYRLAATDDFSVKSCVLNEPASESASLRQV